MTLAAPLFTGTFRLVTLVLVGAFVVLLAASWLLRRVGADAAGGRAALGASTLLRLTIGGISAVTAVAAVRAGGAAFALALLFGVLAIFELSLAGAALYAAVRYSPEPSEPEPAGRPADAREPTHDEPPRCPPNWHWDESVGGCVPDGGGPNSGVREPRRPRGPGPSLTAERPVDRDE